MSARQPQFSDEARTKAAYLYVEAQTRLQNDDVATAYYILRQAQRFAPEDIDINATLGEMDVLLAIDSMAFEKGYQAILKRYFANEKDVKSGEMAANLARQLGRKDDQRRIYRHLMETNPSRPDYAMQYAWIRAYDAAYGDTAGLSDAIGIYDRLEAKVGLTPELAATRIVAYSMVNDTAQMVAETQRMIATAPADPELNLVAARIFNDLNFTDSAMVYADKACALDSTLGDAYIARAQFFLQADDSVNYNREVNHILESQYIDFPSKLDMLTDHIKQFAENPEHKQEIYRLLDRMGELHPGEAELHRLSAGARYIYKDYGRATEELSYAIDLDPENEDLYGQQVDMYLLSGDTLQALNTARKGVENFKSVPFGLVGASLLEYNRHQTADALALLDSLDYDRTPNATTLSNTYELRGDLLWKLDQKDSALAYLDKAVAVNPRNFMALNNAAYFMAVSDTLLDRAERYAAEAVAGEPFNSTFLDTYAWVFFKKKEYKEAKFQIDLALKSYSETDSAEQLVTGLLIVDDNEDLDTIARDADLTFDEFGPEEVAEEVALEEPTAEIYDHAGDIYFMNGLPTEALDFWKKALALAPEDKKILKKVTNKAYFFE